MKRTKKLNELEAEARRERRGVWSEYGGEEEEGDEEAGKGRLRRWLGLVWSAVRKKVKERR